MQRTKRGLAVIAGKVGLLVLASMFMSLLPTMTLADTLLGASDMIRLASTCDDVICNEQCVQAGEDLGNPNWYGLCEDTLCMCFELMQPGDGGSGGGGLSGCRSSGDCPHDQHCEFSGRMGRCVPNQDPCQDTNYVYEHLCECAPELVICNL
jgi:hypothetical protein